MSIVMRPDTAAQDIEQVNDGLRRGWRPHTISGASHEQVSPEAR